MAGNKNINDESKLKHQLNTSFDIDNIKVSEDLIQRTLYRLKEEKEINNLNNHEIHNTSISDVKYDDYDEHVEQQNDPVIEHMNKSKDKDLNIDRQKIKRWNHRFVGTLATIAAAIGIILVTKELSMNNGKLDGNTRSTEIGTLEGTEGPMVKQAAVEEDEYSVTSDATKVENSSDARKIETPEDSSESRINTELVQGEDSGSDEMNIFAIGSIPLEPMNEYLELLTKEEHRSVKLYINNATEDVEYILENKIWKNIIDSILKYETVDIGDDFVSELTYEIRIEKETGIIVIELGNEIKITDEMGSVLYQYEILDSSILLWEINDIIRGL